VLKLCALDQLIASDKTSALLSNDQNFIVIRDSGNIFVYKNSCPHLNKQLATKSVDILDDGLDFIRCARHNALFTLDRGKCIMGPCRTQSLSKVAYRIFDKQLFVSE